MWNRRTYTVNKRPTRVPLLVIYIKWNQAGTPPPANPMLAHTMNYYEDLLFGSKDPSANLYYADISLGQFQWVHAASFGVFNQDLPQDGSGADTPKNLNRLVSLALSQHFDFSTYDRDGNGRVTPNELTLMIISDNGGRIAGANRPLSPICAPAGSVMVCSEPDRGVVEIEDEVQFATLVHEMSHTLGTIDLYGDRGLNYRASLMGPTITQNGPDFVQTFWLDPWHRNQLGWTDGASLDIQLSHLRAASPSPALSLQRGQMAFVWDSSRGNQEYFILERRARSGYDLNVGDVGLAAWYVLEDADRNAMATSYDGAASEPGVVTFTRNGHHGTATFFKPVSGWNPLLWADGTASGFEIFATDLTGGFQIRAGM